MPPADPPGIVELLLHPERGRTAPPPLEVDLRRVLLVGIGMFVVAGIVCGVLLAAGASGALGVAVCGTGVVLGGLGLLWERRRRSRYRDG